MIRSEDKKINLTRPVLLALISVGIILCGLTWWIYRHADLQMREDLVRQAEIVARSINVDLIKSLQADISDENTPGYKKLKNRLTHLRYANPRCRFLYIMGRSTDGKIFIYVDSEPSGSEDESPPGQTYDEAPPSFHEVFQTARSDAVGPLKDRWGSWVSAAIPIVNGTTGELVAVLGMDIDARMWKWDALSFIALHIGLILALIIVVGSMFLAVRRFESGRSGNRS